MYERKNVILVSLILLSTSPYLLLLKNVTTLTGFINIFASVSGLMGTTILLWQFLLGNRRVFRKLTPDFISLNKFHQQLGKYGLLLVFIHPFLAVYKYSYSLSLVFVPKLGSDFLINIALGRIAFYLFLIIIISSVILRKKIKYRPWLYIHYLTYPMMFLVFAHATLIGTFIGSVDFVRYYWFLLTAVFFTTLIFRILRFLNIGKFGYKLTNSTKHPGDITIYTFKPLNKRVLPKPGQFVYLRKSKFSESHPFTVMEFDDKTGKIKFGIKSFGKYTESLTKLKIADIVYIDGPYGVFTKEGHNELPKIILAGGIGVTPFVELVKRYGNSDTKMFYSNKVLDNALLRDIFISKLDGNYIDVVTDESVKGKNIIKGRLNEIGFLEYIDKKILKSANVFICGSSGFMSEMEKMMATLGVPKTNIFYEKFEL